MCKRQILKEEFWNLTCKAVPVFPAIFKLMAEIINSKHLVRTTWIICGKISATTISAAQRWQAGLANSHMLMHNLLCDPWLGPSQEMQSAAFFTFSTHSLQLPFSQHNLGEYYQRGRYATSDPPMGNSGRRPRLLDVYMHTENTCCAPAVWSMPHANWTLCKRPRAKPRREIRGEIIFAFSELIAAEDNWITSEKKEN